MKTLMITAVLGMAVAVLGIINMTGNISSLHWYHRQRVTEENRKAFGKLVGLGTLIIGIAIILYGILYFAFEQTQLSVFVTIGAIALVAGIVTGLIISFYAMVKYNKGIF